MTVPDRVRLPMSFDVTRLQADLAAVSETPWTSHFVPDNYDGDWSVIPLRHAAGETHPIRQIYPDPGATSFVDGPLLEACPYFREVLASFRSPMRTARLMRLTPGSVIKEHSDPDLSVEQGLARLHVPVITNPDVEFLVNGQQVVMEEGSAWYVRLSDPHRVTNAGTTDRVHLVIDVIADAWLSALLEPAASTGG